MTMEGSFTDMNGDIVTWKRDPDEPSKVILWKNGEPFNVGKTACDAFEAGEFTKKY